jgi:hypothetical protein
MIGMKPKLHQPLAPKTKTRPASKGRGRIRGRRGLKALQQ